MTHDVLSHSARPEMNSRTTALERAFELAQSGRFLLVKDIRAQLKIEGYQLDLIQGRALSRQLKEIMRGTPYTYHTGQTNNGFTRS